MKTLKPLAITTAIMAFALVALSPIVRITDSGLGCGEHWPLCNGHLIPPLDNVEVMIEWGHRLSAAAVSVLVFLLAGLAFLQRDEPGVGGKGGILRPATVACVLLVAQILLGAITVWNNLPWAVTATHLGNAMALLAVLSVAAFRAATPEQGHEAQPTQFLGAAIVSAAMGAGALILGAVTANTGAGSACQGFPLCSGQIWPAGAGSGLPMIHWIHRLVAYGLLLHMTGLAFRTRHSSTPTPIRIATQVAFVLTVVQVIIAAIMVLTDLPALWRSLHVIVGTTLWVSLIHLTWKASGIRGAVGTDRAEQLAV
jgi:heme A synthase